MPACKVCGNPAHLFDKAQILSKYHIQYFRCRQCGFIQTEEPYWLQEAYSSAIATQDVGILQRNLYNREVTSAVLKLLFPRVSKGVDFGGGHGIFVRLMRDRGFDFSWLDRHATNDYARGFEYQAGDRCEFLTAFEVLEHLPDPIADLSVMMDLSPNVFVSTTLVPEPSPRIADWWYYATFSGQHISFYTRNALEVLARRFNRQLLSDGTYHLFTTERKSKFCFRLCLNSKFAKVLNRVRRRESLLDTDFEFLRKRVAPSDDERPGDQNAC